MDENNIRLPKAPIKPIKNITRRRNLLPWWIKIFTWVFLIFATVVPIGVIVALFGVKFEISLLGLQTNQPLSVTGLILIALFAFKGLVAFGLWWEKPWAINLAKWDAGISIAVCLAVMLSAMLGRSISLRLELLVIVPYLYKINSLQYAWENIDDQETNVLPLTDAGEIS
jgi:ABC-type antimicrobial peptide transport system permease subunit